MEPHTPTGGVFPSPINYNDNVSQKVSLQGIAASLRFASSVLESTGVPTSSQDTFEAMLQCVRAGHSWQDAMNQNTEEACRG
jgi:hypothetical protein